MPVRRSPVKEPVRVTCFGRLAIASTAAAEARKESASSVKATPVPATAMSTPPTAGPTRRSAIGRTRWSSALACASSSAGRTSGVIASNAGPKNAPPAP